MIPVYLVDLYRNNRLLVLRYFATSFGRAACSVLLVVMIQQFLAVSHQSAGALVRFLRPLFGPSAVPLEMAVLLIMTQLLNSLVAYDNKISTQKLSDALELNIMGRIVRNLVTLSLPFFKRQSEGELIQTVRGDVAGLRTMMSAYAMVVRSSIMALSLAAIVFWLSPLLAFVSLVALPFVAIPLMIYSSKRIRIASRKLRAKGPYFFNAILQIVSGIRVIKTYAGEDREADLCMENSRSFFGIRMEVIRMQSIMQVLLESVGGFSLVAVITLGGYQVARGRMSWDTMVAFVFSTRSLFGPLYEIQGSISDIHATRVAVEHVQKLLDERPQVQDRPDAIPLVRPPGNIAFQDVGFSYGGPQVLHNVSFEVRSGETIGIVGPSGGGKSTLLNLIVRFYDPTSGRVTFDGTDLRAFRLADVYSHIGIVTQDPFLFATSVKENIRCARLDATDAEVMEAARGAWIHDDIMQLSEKYDTVVGVGGRELSRGQAQRVNVARALLRNPSLLILDEATASLDSLAEAEVQRSIDRLMTGRTCFIVAHRLSTLRNADRLMVLDHGACIGFGSHEELLRTCPLYKQFWELQKLGETDLDYISSMMVAPAAEATA